MKCNVFRGEGAPRLKWRSAKKRKYRTIVHCDKCGAEYVSIKHIKKLPVRCKMPECQSSMLRSRGLWRVE